jgi:hypothetical protein
MVEILAPLFYRGDMFAMRAFLAASLTRVLFNLKIDDRTRWFTAIAISATRSPPIACAGIIARQPRPVRVTARLEKRDHIWSVTRADFRGYNDLETSSCASARAFSSSRPPQGKVWNLFDDGLTKVPSYQDLIRWSGTSGPPREKLFQPARTDGQVEDGM